MSLPGRLTIAACVTALLTAGGWFVRDTSRGPAPVSRHAPSPRSPAPAPVLREHAVAPAAIEREARCYVAMVDALIRLARVDTRESYLLGFWRLVELLDDLLPTRHRLLVFVVSDEPDISDALRDVLRSLTARHDVLWALVTDMPVTCCVVRSSVEGLSVWPMNGECQYQMPP